MVRLLIPLAVKERKRNERGVPVHSRGPGAAVPAAVGLLVQETGEMPNPPPTGCGRATPRRCARSPPPRCNRALSAARFLRRLVARGPR